MGLTTRDLLIKAAKPRVEVVRIDSGEEVRIRLFTLGERERIARRFTDEKSENNSAYLVAISLVNDQDELLFDATSEDDIEALNNLDGTVMNDIATAIAKQNKLVEETAETVKADDEEAEKNSPKTPSSPSSGESGSSGDAPPAS